MIDEFFCDHLEYTLTRAFKYWEGVEVVSFWCDGVVPPDLSGEELKEKLLTDEEIVLDAFIGSSGQDRYKILLKLGQRAISQVNQSNELVSCIPDISESFWAIDTRKRIVTVALY
jgi:hypothetical protein